MKNDKLSVVVAPLYLAFYDEVDADLRNRIYPMVDSVVAKLSENAEVTVAPIITNNENVEDLKKLAKEDSVDAVITLHMSYSPSLLICDALKEINKPLLVLDTTCDDGFAEMYGDYLLKNHGIHGVMDMCSVLQSMNVSYRVCAGSLESEAFAKKIKKEMDLLLACARFKNQKIGKTGEKFFMMGDFDVPYSYLEEKFGLTVSEIAEKDLLACYDDIDEEKVNAEYLKEKELYSFEGDEQSLKNNIKQYLALKKFFGEQNITAYTMNFGDFYDSPSPFYAICRLMAEGFGYAGEGDVLTASLGRALNTIGMASFSEIFCPDWSRDLLIFSHMGETDRRFAKKDFPVTLREKAAMGKTLISYYYEYESEARDITIVTWAKTPCGVKLITSKMQIVDYPIMDTFGAPHFVAKTPMPLPEYLEEYSRLGGGHHLYMIAGDKIAEVKAFAQLIGVECQSI